MRRCEAYKFCLFDCVLVNTAELKKLNDTYFSDVSNETTVSSCYECVM